MTKRTCPAKLLDYSQYGRILFLRMVNTMRNCVLKKPIPLNLNKLKLLSIHFNCEDAKHAKIQHFVICPSCFTFFVPWRLALGARHGQRNSFIATQINNIRRKSLFQFIDHKLTFLVVASKTARHCEYSQKSSKIIARIQNEFDFSNSPSRCGK